MASILESNKLVWKFRPLNERTLSLFLRKKIWASSPEYFNDPFESNRDNSKIIELILKRESIRESSAYYEDIREHLEYALDPRPGTYVCFCGTASETLMWSHYAEEHKGVAIGFKKGSSFATPNQHIHENTSLLRVNYGFEHFNSKVETAIKLSKLHYSGDTSISDSALSKIWKDVEISFHFTKAECWKYEQEYRLDAGVDWLSSYDLDSAYNPGYGFEIEFNPKDVVAIVFGVACDSYKKEGLKSLMDAIEWKHVKLLDARKDDTSLKVFAC